MPGPRICTDIVDVYVFRHDDGQPGHSQAEFLQMKRAANPMAGTWQPVMGHVEGDESAVDTALRELAEETGWVTHDGQGGLLALWQLEPINAYFLVSQDAVMLSPCFAARVTTDETPVLDAAHDDHRWVPRDQVDRQFLWPGQRQAIEQIVHDILPADSPVASHLEIDLTAR